MIRAEGSDAGSVSTPSQAVIYIDRPDKDSGATETVRLMWENFGDVRQV